MYASPSYPLPAKILPNLYFIRKHGIKAFVTQQNKRMALLRTMIREFDDGRSRSFFCRAAILYDPNDLANAIRKATALVAKEGVRREDRKGKSRILRRSIVGMSVVL